MGRAQSELAAVISPNMVNDAHDWVRLPPESAVSMHCVESSLSRQCRDWPKGEAEEAVQAIISQCLSRSENAITVFTDGSVDRKNSRSGWGCYVRSAGSTQVLSGCVSVVTSSMSIEGRAITKFFQWYIDSECTEDVIVVTDSLNNIKKVCQGLVRPEWGEACGRISNIYWVYCPGHSGVVGNEVADRLAGDGIQVDSDFRIGRGDVLRLCVERLGVEMEGMAESDWWVESMVGRGVVLGSGRLFKGRGRERRIRNQLLVGVVGLPTLRCVWRVL